MDIKDAVRENILLLWMKYEHLICSLFPAHRRNNPYFCDRSIEKRLRSEKMISLYFQEALERTNEHHSAISFYFSKKTVRHTKRSRNTVEFRLGEGTTDPEFIRNWVLFLLHFMERCNNVKSQLELVCDLTVCVNAIELTKMADDFKITDKRLLVWLHDRFDKYR